LSLSKGSRIGPYEIVGSLGAGGMGEVYRARDSKLNRDVAIKVLPESFAHDPDRLIRFEREAQVLATLNHPNIAHIYGLESSSGAGALVMELVEGEDLSELIARGPIPFADALPIAKQIADALEAAHELGIIHRDLKPANIKVRADGTVKVLDFGLAKALDPTSSATAEAMNSPTLTVRGTQMGLIIGTAAYMSPEQARGKTVDRRADIWAFGVVFYEMLTAQRAFKGEDISITLASVLKDELNWQALPPDVPEPVRRLLRRCLERDPKRRLRDIGEARLILEEPFSSQPAATATAATRATIPFRRRALPVVATAVIVAAAAGILWWITRPLPAPALVTRFPIVLGQDQRFARMNLGVVAVSPDGSRLAYVANRQLYLRSMSEAEARPVPGTNVDPASPFFSPDGQWLGFSSMTSGALQKIPVAGGTPLTICKANSLGAHWDGDTVVFATNQGIMRVPSDGGEPTLVVKVGDTPLALGPQLLDNGRLLLYTIAAEGGPLRWDTAEIIVQSLTSGERRVVARGGSAARYLPTGLRQKGGRPSQGHLVYVVGNALMAVPFDLARLETRGAPVMVVEHVASSIGGFGSGIAHYSVSATGMLAYVPGTAGVGVPQRIAFATRDGRIEAIDVPLQPYVHPRVAPDGRHLAVGTDDSRGADVWVYDLKARGSLRRLTFAGRNLFPIWTPDGRFITFQSDRDGDRAIFRQPADGSGPAERLTKPEAGGAHEPESWSPDGKILSMSVIRRGESGVWTTTMEPGAKAMVIANTPAVEKHSSFSADGRWLAYMVTTTGSNTQQVFVEPYPPTGAKYQVTSTGGSRTPVFSADGKELFFHQPGSNRLTVVDIRAEKGLTFGTPVPLPIEDTIHPIAQRNYDVSPDGKQLLVVLPAQTAQTSAGRAEQAQINVVLNWFDELAQRAPVRQ
jgi:Tol biopolymer transport system component